MPTSRSVVLCGVCAVALGYASVAGSQQASFEQPQPVTSRGDAASAFVAAPGLGSAPVVRPAYPFETRERTLQTALNASVARLGYQRLIDAGRLAVSVVDLGASEPRYAALNGNRMMYAASLPKIAILLGAFDAIEQGRLQNTVGLRDAMTRMIRVSSNSAATDVLQRVGFENVAATLTSPALRLYDGALGGLWVGKAYGQGLYWRRDPIANLSHGATARQTARFFVMLDRGELVSPTASAAMKQMLGRPGISHKFVKGLASRPGATIYRKSGTWRDYHADAALVVRPDSRYVVVGMVQDGDGERILQRIAVAVDDLVRKPGQPRAVVAR